MNCEILETLYVRSNGDVLCNDDAGEEVLLGLVRTNNRDWSVTSLVTNHSFRHIRRCLARNEVPWPDVCQRCAFFRPFSPFSDSLSERRVRKLQIEPSLSCRLRCPACTNQHQVQVRPHPLQMDLELFDRILCSLRDEGYTLGEIEYCGQGEPLLHPNFSEFVARARKYFPATRQRLITSGNFDFASTVRDAALNEIMVSCDGVFLESYSRYRIGGAVERVLHFLRDARASASFPGLLLVWKYILFEWNDSTEELTEAQRNSEELGVDYLLFVYTHSVGKSRRHTFEDPSSLPVRGARIVRNATPIHYRSTQS